MSIKLTLSCPITSYDVVSLSASLSMSFGEKVGTIRGGGDIVVQKVVMQYVCQQALYTLCSRGSNPNDPPTVIHARQQEKQIIAKWLQQ